MRLPNALLAFLLLSRCPLHGFFFFLFPFFKILCMYVRMYLLRAQAGGGGGGEAERISSRLHAGAERQRQGLTWGSMGGLIPHPRDDDLS